MDLAKATEAHHLIESLMDLYEAIQDIDKVLKLAKEETFDADSCWIVISVGTESRRLQIPDCAIGSFLAVVKQHLIDMRTGDEKRLENI